MDQFYIVLPTALPVPTMAAPMAERLAKKLLIIGWDAADWMIIDALFARGAMPNLKKLVDGGVRADLSTLEPRLSPLLWTTIATGKTADKHGILNFIEPDPTGAGLRVASSTTRKTKALWNILSQSGMAVNVVSWYASHPAEPINGCCVTNLFQEGVPKSARDPWPILNGAVHPADRSKPIAGIRVHPNAISDETLRPLLPKLRQITRTTDLFKSMVKHIAQAMSVHRVAKAVLAPSGADRNWDCTMVFYDTIDTMGHHFMEFHPPRMPHVSESDFEQYRDVMSGVYQRHDTMLGELLDAAGPEATVILLSDHGFYSDHLRPVTRGMTNADRSAIEAMWHRPTGVLVMSGPPFKRGERTYGASILDITPTALTLLGLPVGMDMDGRVLSEASDRATKLESLLSWDMVDGESGQHPPDMQQNPFESHDAMKQLVDLGYMAALTDDAAAAVEIARRETRFNLGTVLMTTGHPDQAIPVYEGLVRSNPDDSRYMMCLARCHFMGLRFDESIRLLRDFLSRHPGYLEARIFLAGVLATAKRQDEAAAELSILETACNDRRDLDIAIGDVYYSLARWDDAMRHYLLARKSDPTNVHVHLGLARTTLGQERFSDAAEHCLDAVEIQHILPEAHYLLGVALTWMKDFDHAMQSFKVAISMAPGILDAHRYLASIYRHLGDRTNAAKHRVQAEKLVESKATGTINAEFLKREAPMGPQQWARAIGQE